MNYSNYVTLSAQEANDIYIALVEYISEAEDKVEEIELELNEERLIKYNTDFLTRIHKVKDKILSFTKISNKGKAIPFLGVCK